MADITASAQQSLDSLLQKLGVTKSSSAAPVKKTQLGQEDFLKLMTAQLSNQDPFQPQSNDQMIAQMAQFSTVSGIAELNVTMKNVATQLSENRIATAMSFVGKTVLVPGSTATADDTGGISGAIDLPNDVTGLTVQITRENGELVKSLDLGANAAGLVGFQWDGRDTAGKTVGDKRYLVKAMMTSAGKQSQANTDVYAPITEATLPQAGQDQTFKVLNIGSVKMTDIKGIKY
jgi:flagellar basal-body rod modification protein FlgD